MNYSKNTNQRYKTAVIAIIFALVFVVITCTLLGMATPTSGTDETSDTTIPNTDCSVVQTSTTPEVKEPEIISLGEFRLTAYCGCSKCCGKWGENRPLDENGKPIVYTANMTVAKEGVTIAADISVLPYGTKVIIDGHEYIVQDRGGSIKENRIDIYFESHQDALNFGVQYKEIFTERMVENND